MKMIKEMSKEEYTLYRHNIYLKHKDKRREYQKQYYQEHRDRILADRERRYKIKCGLKVGR